MALNVGELYAKISVKADGVDSELNKVKTGLEDVKKSADKVEDLNVDVQVKNKDDLDKAKRSTDGLTDSAKRAADASGRIKFPKDYAPDAERAKKSISNLEGSIAGAAAKFTKFTAAAAGTAVVGTIGTSLVKGFQRLDSIDQATAKLEALGNSGSDVEKIMDNALASVKGTSFGMGEAATVSAQMVASGIEPGERLESVLGTVADTAAIAGSSMADMGLIFGSVAARGKLQGDDLMQLLGRGVPVLQILAEQTGKTSAEISEMVSEGEIDFQTFADAMEGYVGGGAKRMGDTVSGSLKNLGAAFGRVGAEATKGLFAEAPDVINKLTGQVDGLGEVVGPIAAEWSARLTPAIGEAATSVIPMAAAALGTLSDGLEMSLPLLKALTSAITAVPTPVLAAGLLTLTARHQGWTKAVEEGALSLRNWTRYARSADGFGGKMAATFRSASTPMMVLGRETRLSARELSGMARVSGTAKGALQQFGGVATGVGRGAVSGLKSGLGGIVSLLGGPWGVAIMGATTVLGFLAAEHMKAKQAEQEHEQAQRELGSTLDETTGSITAQTTELQRKRAEENGWIQTANELGLSASTVTDAMNGNADAMREVEATTNAAKRTAIESSKVWQEHGERFRAAGIDSGLMADALNGNADAANQVSRAMDAVPNERLRKEQIALKREVEGSTEKFDELRDGINGAADDLDKIQAEKLRNGMLEMEKATGLTRQAFEQLGDSIVGVPDEKTILVDSMAPAVRDEFRELGFEVEEGADGQVRLTFPDGMSIMAVLDEIGAKATRDMDGRINLSDNTPEVQQRLIDLGIAVRDEKTGEVRMKDNIAEVMGKQIELEAAIADPMTGELHVNDNIALVKQFLTDLEQDIYSLPAGQVRIMDDTPQVRAAVQKLGIETATLPGGHVAITDTSDENIRRLADLGITTESLPPGHVGITDTTDDNIRRLNDLGITTKKLPDGRVIISDNADKTAANIKSILAPERINTFSEHVVNITRRITDVFSRGDAHGGVYDGQQRAVAFADGGTTRALEHAMGAPRKEPAHLATITPPGTYRVHGESETGGEAYIPLSETKRDRSTRILDRVAGLFGYNLVDNQGHAIALKDGAVLPGAAVVQKLKYMDGTPYIFGGWSPAGVDCSGAVSLGVNTALGEEDPFKAGRTATAGEGAWLSQRGFQRGRGAVGDIRVAFVNGGPGGGHTAMQLDNGDYIESGGNTGGGFTINRGAGPLEGRNFTDFYYLPGAAPLDANAGLEYFDKLATVAGKGIRNFDGGKYDDTDTAPTKEPQRELNGGAGTLLRDGSVMELVAAIYSASTGKPMDDDIVSWGQAIGLYSEVAEEDEKKSAKEIEKLTKSVESKTEKLEDKREQLPLAEEDLRLAKMKRDETYNKTNKKGEKTATDSQKAAADQKVAKAERRVEKLKQEIAELEREIEEQENTLNGLDSDVLTPTDELKKASGTSGNKYADEIIKEGRRRGISDRGIKIALATALVESNLKMYANPADPASMKMPHDAVGYDHDSVGLFQQRNNGAWGTTADRMDAAKSAGMFYDKLDDADYNAGDEGAHAQRVQVSAFPGRYSQRMGEAQGLLDRYNQSSGMKVTAMADGGILGNARSASINEGSAVLWAEDGPEAYIPLSSNKRAQSLEIWKETGKRLGVDVASMFNLVGAALPGLIQGQLDFSTGSTTSLDALGLNQEAAAYRLGRGAETATQNAVGAVFNGPVQINDPKKYLQGQLDNAGKQLGNAMRSVMLK